MSEFNDAKMPPYKFIFRKASVGKRFAAYLIDFVIFSFITNFIFVFGLSGMLANYTDEASMFFYSLIFIVIACLIFCFRDIIKGQSIGKRILGIGVRDVSDRFAVPSIPRLFLRQIFTFLWCIEFLVLIFNDEHRKMGDLIADTGVYDIQEYDNFIRLIERTRYAKQEQNPEYYSSVEPHTPVIEPHKPKRTKIAMLIVGAMLLLVIFIGAIFFGITSMFRNHPSYIAATESIRTNSEIMAVIGEIESFSFMPMGNIHTSPGRGDADFSIRAIGPYGEVRVFVELQMRGGGNWEVIRFDFVQIR